jgi:hypothetical protein
MSLFENTESNQNPFMVNRPLWMLSDEELASLPLSNEYDDLKLIPLSRNKTIVDFSTKMSTPYNHTVTLSRLFVNAQPPVLYSRLISSLTQNKYADDEDDEDEYAGIVKKGNIILDMDGTLGDNIPAHFVENPERYKTIAPIPRPGLRKFLKFVFAHYERVSIWTAATSVWYNKFKREVLKPNMPPGTEFHFERVRSSDEPYIALKPLSDIYAKYPEYNETNTVIVDDNENTFKSNMENAIHINAFFYDKLGLTPEARRINAEKDKALYKLINILQKRLAGELTGFQLCDIKEDISDDDSSDDDEY